MAPRTPDAPEKSHIDEQYDELLSPLERGRQNEIDARTQGLKNSEQDAGEKSDVTSNGGIHRQEQLGGKGQWKSLYERQDSTPKPSTFSGKLKGIANKKGGPAALIIGLLLGGGFGMSVLLGPSLLIVHMTEIITGKENAQLASMEKRTSKILAKQMGSKTTSGVCTIITLRCKYNTMSDRMKTQFEKAGIKVVTDPENEKTLLGRHKPTHFEFNNKTITAETFQKELVTDSEFRSAVQKAYNPKFAGFADKVWGKVAARLKISKKAPFDETVKDDEERTKILEEDTKNGQNAGDVEDGKYKKVDDEWQDSEGNAVLDEQGNPIDDETANLHNSSFDIADDIKKGAGEVADSGEKIGSKSLVLGEEALTEAVEGAGTASIENFLKITGVADTACSAYGAVQAVSYGAKVIRAVQMARYAMVFLTTASMIKSGDAKPEDVAFLGAILTKTISSKVTDATGKVKTVVSKAATDSYGYRYVAYGDKGPLTPSATQFLAGGGLGGKMSGVLDKISSYLPGDKRTIQKTCKTLKNPFVQAGSLVAGIALMIIPGGQFAIGAKDVAQGILFAAIGAAMVILPNMLKDIVAGILVDNTTFGEQAGDAIVSGSGSLMSTLAGMGGNAPLHPDQAVAYAGVQNQVLAQYAEADRLAYSPLDPSNPNTFMGKIVTQLLPYDSQMSSLTSVMTTSASIVTRSLSSIFTPAAFAASDASDFTQCQDYDYKQINLATDPFCNPIRGIPPGSLGLDPEDVATSLIGSGDIDEITGEPKSDKYKKFIADCIDRERPLGDTGENFDQEDGKNCFIDDSADGQIRAQYYVNYVDQRVLDGMDNGYINEGGGSDCIVGAGAQISQDELKKLITSYGLPAPDQAESQKLLEHLTSDPSAAWAAKSLLGGEKTYKQKGGAIKEYLTTAWVWFETGQDLWPDPYEMNCQDKSVTLATEFCGSGNFQVAGYQPNDTKDKFAEVYKRLYSEGELSSVMQKVVENSSKASRKEWNYNDASQSGSGNATYAKDLSGVSLSSLWPSTSYSDPKAQIQSLILGKDPAMAAGLNSFAVSDGDVVQMLKDCHVLPWSNNSYYCDPAIRTLISNMIMALYMLDSGGGASAGAGCASSSVPPGSGKGIAAIFGGGEIPGVTQEFGPTEFSSGAGASLYGYATEYGMNPPGHTGVDYGVGLDGKLYSPVDGTVEIAGGTPYFRSTDRLDGSGTSLPGTGELLIRMSNGNALILGHMHEIVVKVGDHVTVGQYVGLSGTENGPHVHVEYRTPDTSTSSGERLVDPRKYL